MRESRERKQKRLKRYILQLKESLAKSKKRIGQQDFKRVRIRDEIDRIERTLPKVENAL